MKVYESHDHEFTTFFNHDSVDKLVQRKNTNEIYYARVNGETGIKVNKWVFINGEKYVLQWPKVLHYPVSLFDNSSCKITVIYRGKVYSIAGMPSWTIPEISKLYACLSDLWKDVYHDSKMPDIIRSKGIIEGKQNSHYFDFARDKYNKSFIPFINGNTDAIYRKITVADLSTPYKEIEKSVKEFEEDKEEAERVLSLYSIHMAEYLCLTVKRYKNGSFNLNDQMIKRLHLKINSKTK